MRISVVTVTYNARNELEKTIRSVLAQGYEDIEYIIIDGGSSDGTIDLVEKFGDKISVFISEPDGGIYDAMRKGLQNVTGKWVNYMNAGDTFVSTGIVSSVVDLIKDSSAPDVIYGDHIYSHMGVEELRVANIERIFSNICFNHQSMFYRASVLEKYHFDPQFEIVADCAQHVCVYNGGNKFVKYGGPIARFLGGGAHSQNRLKTIVEFMLVLTKYSPKAQPLRDTEILNLFLTEVGISQPVQKDVSRRSNGPTIQKLDELASVSFFRNPVKKIRLYKTLMESHRKMKRVRS